MSASRDLPLGLRKRRLEVLKQELPEPPKDIKLSGERSESALLGHAFRGFAETGWVQRDGQCWRTRNAGKPLAIPLHVGRRLNDELLRQHLRKARLRDFEMSGCAAW